MKLSDAMKKNAEYKRADELKARERQQRSAAPRTSRI